MSGRGYENIAEFYDHVLGNSSDEINFVKRKIRKLSPSAKNILELGCGTGNNLYVLEKKFSTRGIDNSPAMLEIAAGKTVNTEYFEEDIINYRSEKKFDVIICLYDTINHLLKYNDWENLFSNTHRNLSKNGIFVFDMNTLFKLELISAISPIVNKSGENILLANIKKRKGNIYNWNLKLFEKKSRGMYKLHETNILETSYEISLIVNKLSEKFKILDISELNSKRINQESERVYFFCRKK
ncbi:MAG: Trans-aconitate 2-methyltransferase [Ignavibacteria bacterium]|nr:Trans-aconitate 2-methyltransferase [Ignavibacteria bacterium]